MSADRLSRAKFAYTTRNVPLKEMAKVEPRPVGGGQSRPRSGDLVLARVDELGHHAKLETRHGRRAHMFSGDEIVVCFGNRYAPDQFEAEVPVDLDPCSLVAAGGIAARMLSAHDSVAQPTRISPIGFVCDASGARLNLESFRLAPLTPADPSPPTLAVVGTSMNSGKTTTAVNLVRGLSCHGLKVGAAKITGTGAGGDVWRLWDAGAHRVLDFTDAGFASTYRAPVARIERSAEVLSSHLAQSGVDVVVLEVADGISQCETAMLLRSQGFVSMVDHFLFAAGDALGAAAGLEALSALGLPVAAVSGLLTASPLAIREAQALFDVPIVDSSGLCDPAALGRLGLVPERERPVQRNEYVEREPEPAGLGLMPAPASAAALA